MFERRPSAADLGRVVGAKGSFSEENEMRGGFLTRSPRDFVRGRRVVGASRWRRERRAARRRRLVGESSYPTLFTSPPPACRVFLSAEGCALFILLIQTECLRVRYRFSWRSVGYSPTYVGGESPHPTPFEVEDLRVDVRPWQKRVYSIYQACWLFLNA